jgi:cyclopropane-fatty-acyl-phospholipid synthase
MAQAREIFQQTLATDRGDQLMNAFPQTLTPPLPRRAWSSSAPARIVLDLLDTLQGGAIAMQLPGQPTVVLGSGEILAHWNVRDTAMFERLLETADIGLGESWMDGQWECDNLPALLGLLARNRARLGRAMHGKALALLAHRLLHLARSNTRRGSRRNITAHYDLGNDFYRLWLDPGMTYSAACFASPDEPLVVAQTRKYQRILQALDAREGQHILEIGCGWGGFAEVAARDYGCRVRALTLSPQQRAYAIERATRGGWSDRVSFDLCDYRDVQGRYDHIVSIEMIEAVGERYWPTYYRQLARNLAPDGRAVLQAITIDESLFGKYRRGTDFIQRHIFPGGMLPTPARIRDGARGAGLEMVDERTFGMDYARTLQHWSDSFNARLSEVRDQGFDDRFVRMWQFYLAYCEAGFTVGDIDVSHITFEHAPVSQERRS